MHKRIARSMALGGLVFGLLALEAGAQESAVVVLRTGEAIQCEKFASARNYSLCFREASRLVTVNHADLWKVEASPLPSNALAQSDGAGGER